jgi:hypothetical protein
MLRRLPNIVVSVRLLVMSLLTTSGLLAGFLELMGVVKNYRESLASLSSELACPDQVGLKLALPTLDAKCNPTLTPCNMSDVAVM